MIISNNIGGLGNQMFQYASAKALSESLCTSLKVDIRDFNNYKLHQGFELNRVFNCDAQIADKYEIKALLGLSSHKLIKRILRRSEMKWLRHRNHIVEPHFHFWSPFLSLKNNIYLDGYWQSEQYFKKIESEIISEFTFKLPMNALNSEFAERIKTTNSVSLHIRRGDYVSNPRNAFIGICSLDYYFLAVKHICNLVHAPHFFIFSDDIDWVKNNLFFDSTKTYVDFNKGADSYNDMRLMSMCKHNIIANSSFSWWGAWLNSHQDKIVIAPKQWFASNLIDDSDLVPKSWIRL